jgi:5-methylcytosine-specific restriction protein A
MPSKPKQYCARCRVAHDAGGCPEKGSGWLKRQQGTTTTKRGYGHAWRKIRDRIMTRDNWLCKTHARQGKLVKATAVDHIIPKGEGGTDDDPNLEAICDACHAAKTKLEAARSMGRGG